MASFNMSMYNVEKICMYQGMLGLGIGNILMSTLLGSQQMVGRGCFAMVLCNCLRAVKGAGQQNLDKQISAKTRSCVHWSFVFYHSKEPSTYHVPVASRDRNLLPHKIPCIKMKRNPILNYVGHTSLLLIKVC